MRNWQIYSFRLFSFKKLIIYIYKIKNFLERGSEVDLFFEFWICDIII